jgi:hypothetical protein
MKTLTKSWTVVCLSVLLLSTSLLPTQKAQAFDCNTTGLSGGCGLDKTIVKVNDIINVRAVTAGTASGSCNVSNITLFICKPTGQASIQCALENGFAPANGGCTGCPLAQAPECLPPFPPTCPPITAYTVSASDIGQPNAITTGFPQLGIPPFTITYPGRPHLIQFIAAYAGTVPPGDNQAGNPLLGNGTCNALVITPCMRITKECIIDCPPTNAAVYGQPIRFRGTVCNDFSSCGFHHEFGCNDHRSVRGRGLDHEYGRSDWCEYL